MIPWHSLTAEEALCRLDSRPEGLSEEKASQRLAEHGPNHLESPYKPSPARIFLSQLQNYMVFVLIFAALVSFISGESTNAYVVLGIVFFIVLLGFIQEYKAERAMEALREMVAPFADVLRDGRMRSIPAQELVPGDVVYLEAGDKIPADGRIIEESSLQVVEASLTGESLPAEKQVEPVGEESVLAERKSMVFMGTILSYGNCRAVVTATSLETELGRISGLIQKRHEDPPLKAKLQQLAKHLAVLVLIASATVFAVEVGRGSPVLSTLITASALAVAGVPESLPFVVTLTLAYGTQLMARKKAIIRSLPAVETLGSTTVICTDKTGTLTKNEMTVREMRTYRDVEVTGSGYDPEGSFLSAGKPIDPAEEDIALLLRIGVLCNNANVLLAEGRWEVMGDPTEGSLIVAARKAGALEMIRDGHVRISEHPFDSERKRMTTVVRPEAQDAFFVAMKGAPEVVLEQCSHIAGPTGSRPLDEGDRREILEAAAAMARRALRVLAFSWKTVGRDEPLDRDHVESDLIFAGLVGMMDPPRREAVEAIHTCKLAGIRPVMITGDHRLTARAISAELGIGGGEVVEGSELARMSDEELFKRIEEISVFARVTAEHKVRIVEALKKHGHIVTMTGDGVNDAPALKAADIGVAMGQTGTEVAKEASDMVITDDNFATIVGAVEEGRRIYDNIRKGTSYLLSVNLAEVMTIFLGVILGLPVPLLALQILWINVVAEEFPAMGLSVEPAHPDIMRRKPRNPREPILSRDILIYTLGISTSIFAGSLGLYVLTLQAGHELGYARTTAFAALGFFTLYNAYSSRSLHDSVLRMDPAGNKKLLLGIGAGAMAVLAAIYLPFMQSILGTLPLRIETWLMIAAASVVVVLAAEILKTLLPGLKQ